MQHVNISTIYPFLLLLLLAFVHGCTTAEATVSQEKEEKTKFELHHGDRVVLLGNSLFQNDLEYGYIEYALTTEWPERDITFRNLGWTGDTVHGDARSYYTAPPDSYELLIQQLKEAQPTVVFVGYGANEAYEGKEGVGRFKEGLNKLLDEINKLDARAILLSPIPQMAGLTSVEGLTERNKNLKLYSSVISQTASERKVRYINLFDPINNFDNKDVLTTNGIHLNESGYYYLASVIEDGLGLSPRKWKVEVDLAEQVIEASGSAMISESHFSNGSVKFTIDNPVLPLPPPESNTALEVYSRAFRISGLNKGCYTLSVDADDVASASSERWLAGVRIKQGVLFRQANELRKLIIHKNQLYFRKYRPTNRTYLVGFRSHEQGHNSKELEQIDLFISRLEDQIFHLREPRPQVFRVNAVQ